MRRRTKRMGGRRSIIYLIVVGLLLAAHYIYDNFAPEVVVAAEPSEEVMPIEDPSAEAAPRKTTGTQWAELPAMKRQSDDIYITSHHSGEMRNYTVCYSSEHHAPLWVAAPRHRAYTGDVKRVDNYDFDPTLPVNIQTRLNRSYGDYTRGHMLGSAERTATTHMNNQTFYVTNIAPQLRDGFNESGGAWNNLEYFVDRQVCADTLYVVTGAIYERFTDSDGTTIEPRTTKNKNDGKLIGVPTAYYKVLLRTKSGRTGRSVRECSASELKCAAFIVGHRSASGRKPSAEDMIPVRELERMTGIDFFAAVPNAPEKEANPADWGL
jgi:DNA/RNA endonuclease G (NUC1)